MIDSTVLLNLGELEVPTPLSGGQWDLSLEHVMFWHAPL